MEVSVVALIIVVATIVLYAIDRFPMAVVSLASLLAMVATGVLTFAEAFKGFSSNLVMLVAGMMIIGNALFENGVAEKIGQLAFRRYADDERKMLIAVMIVSAVLSGFLHNISVMAMMMPIIAVHVSRSNGRLKLKNFYMALSHAVIVGARITIVGSSPPVLAQEILLSTEGVSRGFGFFELSLVTIPVLIVLLAAYYFLLYPLGDKLFDHSFTGSVVTVQEKKEYIPWKMWLSGIVVVLVALGFAFTSHVQRIMPNVNTGTISMMGAMILVLAGCVDFKTELRRMDWNTLIVLASATGFSACFTVSGLGDRIAGLLVHIGGVATSPVLLVILLTVATALLVNLMANSAATAVFAAIAISVALRLGIDPVPMVAAVVFGGGSAVVMPTSTATLTMSAVAGYRFRDYAIIGAIVSALCVVVSIVMIILVYGLI